MCSDNDDSSLRARGIRRLYRLTQDENMLPPKYYVQGKSQVDLGPPISQTSCSDVFSVRMAVSSSQSGESKVAIKSLRVLSGQPSEEVARVRFCNFHCKNVEITHRPELYQRSCRLETSST
jgi:hypothetical protein